MPLTLCFDPIVAPEAPEATNDGNKDVSNAVKIETGIVHGSCGSAMLNHNGVTIICSVNGPKSGILGKNDMDIACFDCEIKYAPFVDQPGYPQGMQSFGATESSKSILESSYSQSKNLSTTSVEFTESILQTFSKEALIGSVRLQSYPKMSITLHFTVLQSSGNIGVDLSAIISCGSVALMDSSIEIYDVITASTVGINAKKELVMEIEQFDKSITSYVTVATRANSAELAQLWSEGRVEGDNLFPMIELACKKNAQLASKIESEC